jgi:hypothetical protein
LKLERICAAISETSCGKVVEKDCSTMQALLLDTVGFRNLSLLTLAVFCRGARMLALGVLHNVGGIMFAAGRDCRRLLDYTNGRAVLWIFCQPQAAEKILYNIFRPVVSCSAPAGQRLIRLKCPKVTLKKPLLLDARDIVQPSLHNIDEFLLFDENFGAQSYVEPSCRYSKRAAQALYPCLFCICPSVSSWWV